MLILGIAGLAKVVTAGTESPAFALPDEILSFMSSRQVMLLGGVAELLAVTALLCRVGQDAEMMVFGGFAGAFSAYRLAFWVGGFKLSCNCFGRFWQAFGLDTIEVDRINTLLFGLYVACFGIYVFSAGRWKRLLTRRAKVENAPSLRGNASRARETIG
ncbi:MAG: hypothetical protein H7A47_14995 [Verrucomicrobiales bacterium]|nr:hypothetical protein [Verrucomicrobiales bacterium]